MKVKARMTPNPITVTEKTSYNEAVRLMNENQFHHLPVVDKRGALIGMVSHEDLLSAKPSDVTTLSVFEIVSLLEKVTIGSVMQKPVYAVEEDCSLSNAALFMTDKKISCLPVLSEGKLAGLITDTDIFRAFIEITGGGQSGSRLEVKMPDEKGMLAKVCTALAESDSYIVSVAISYDRSNNISFADIKERDGEEKKIRAALNRLENIELTEFRDSEQDKLITIG